MTAPVYALPLYPVFHDLSGKPLDAGFVYIGVSGSNAEASPLPVFWDEDQTIPIAQPIRTINGYPARNGSQGAIYVAGDYSITVRDKQGRLVYSALKGVNFAEAATAEAQAAANAAEAALEDAVDLVNMVVNVLPIERTAVGDGFLDTLTFPGVYLEKERFYDVSIGGVAQLSEDFSLSNDGTSTTLMFVEPFPIGAIVRGKVLQNIALSGGQSLAFADRAAVLAWIAANPAPPVGTVLQWGGIGVRYIGSGTAIADMPGYVPDGVATPDHFAENTSPGFTDMTAAIQSAVDAFPVVELRASRYRISDTIIFSGRVPHFYGQGRGMGPLGSSMHNFAPTRIEWYGAENKPVLSYNPGAHDDVSIKWGGVFEKFSIYGMRVSGVVGIRCGAKTAQATYRDLEITGVDTGFSMFQNAYACLFDNCAVSDFSSDAWLLNGVNHNTKFFGCTTNFNSARPANSSVTVKGTDGGGSTALSFIGCDFDLYDQVTALDFQWASGVVIDGCYFEARSTNTLNFIKWGSSGLPSPVSGLTATGCIFGGQSFARELIYVTEGASVFLAGNLIYGFTGSVVNNAVPGICNRFGNNRVTSTPSLFVGGDSGWTDKTSSRLASDQSFSVETAVLDYSHPLQNRLRKRRVSAEIRITAEDATATSVAVIMKLQRFNGTTWSDLGSIARATLFVNAGTRGIVGQTVNFSEVDATNSVFSQYRVLVSPGIGDAVIILAGSAIRVEELDT